MNIKIIISLILFVSTHHNFCMLIKQDQKKHTTHIHAIQQKYQQKYQQKVDYYLESFTFRSLSKNSELFHQQDYLVQRGIIHQCKDNHDTSPIITLVRLPKDMQISVISYFFTNQCRLAAEDFINRPLEISFKEYNALPDNNLTLLSSKHNLSPSMIFRSSKKLQTILTKIYTDDVITTRELEIFKKQAKDIVQKILEQNPTIKMLENKNKLIVFLTTPYYAQQLPWASTFKKFIAISTIGIDFFCASSGYTQGAPIETIAKAVLTGTIVNPLLLFALYNDSNRSNLSTYYNTATTSTITKPLKSLL